jgi:hypothetical protein
MDCRVKPGNDGGGKLVKETWGHTLMKVDFLNLWTQPRQARNIASFPCHFGPLGLERRHVRGPRTPGGLLRDGNGPRIAAFNF